jgi:hypothetical protein
MLYDEHIVVLDDSEEFDPYTGSAGTAAYSEVAKVPGVVRAFGVMVGVAISALDQSVVGVLQMAVYRLGAVGLISAEVDAGGTGYAVGDQISVVQSGCVNGKLQVTSVSGGVVTGLKIIDPGKGYYAATGVATLALTGSGNNDLTVKITNKNVLGYVTLTIGSKAGTLLQADAVNMVTDQGAFPPIAPAKYMAGDKLVVEVKTEAVATGGYTAGTVYPYILVHQRGEHLAQEPMLTDQTPAIVGS